MLIVRLLVSYAHVHLCHFFSTSMCQGLAATSASGSFWTIMFTFLKYSAHVSNALPYITCILH